MNEIKLRTMITRKKCITRQVGNMYIRICNKCGAELPLTNEYFPKDSHNSHGFNTICKTCKAIAYDLTQKENAEKLLQQGIISPDEHKIITEGLEMKDIPIESIEAIGTVGSFSSRDLLAELFKREKGHDENGRI